MSSSLLSLDNAVFRQFAFYAGIVICKTMAMSPVTAFHRLTKKVFINPEDCKGAKPVKDKKVVPTTDEGVERVRRCHLNDLENVIPFVLIGLLYVTTNPDPTSALIHFRIFAVSRVLHTFAYLLPLPQPSRVMCFLAGLLSTFSMAYTVLINAEY